MEARKETGVVDKAAWVGTTKRSVNFSKRIPQQERNSALMETYIHPIPRVQQPYQKQPQQPSPFIKLSSSSATFSRILVQ
jgi:hypothetical protein